MKLLLLALTLVASAAHADSVRGTIQSIRNADAGLGEVANTLVVMVGNEGKFEKLCVPANEAANYQALGEQLFVEVNFDNIGACKQIKSVKPAECN